MDAKSAILLAASYVLQQETSYTEQMALCIKVRYFLEERQIGHYHQSLSAYIALIIPQMIIYSIGASTALYHPW